MNMKLDVPISTLAKETWREFGDDHLTRLGAALAYYTFTSFFPLMLVLISLIGIALSFNLGPAENAQQYVMDMVSKNLPAAKQLLTETFNDTEQNSGTLGLAGLLTGLWAASNIFAQLEESFNTIYDVAPRKRSFIDTMKARGQAALIVVLIAVLMIGSLLFGTALQAAESFAQSLPGGVFFGWLLNLLISLTLSSLVFAALFKYIPDKPVSWKAAIIGGVFTSITWQIGRELLTWWLGRSSDSVTAGTVVGSVLAFLVLIYYASQILLFGAQVTATYDQLANPDLVRHRTSSDSALRGPGQPPVTESGKTVGTTSKSAPGKSSLGSFATGFVAGILALLVGARSLLGKVLHRE
ncbi:MAG: YihY/virulence factor BrkB family protein [Ardenticatenales bacterium]|nr:YihY/virulence factor BrkB family protein [Ardenticatenales bacterium]